MTASPRTVDPLQDAPRTSLAVRVARHGGPEVLTPFMRDTPRPGIGEALIRVEAAGVAYADVLMRGGRYPGGPKAPFIAGWDVMGRVVAVGGDGGEELVGRRVLALVLTGGYAAHAVTPVDRMVMLPDGVDPFEAACLTMNYVTAWQMLRAARPQLGQRILVYGAAGGVGGALLDLARSRGLEVLGVGSSHRAGAILETGARFIDRVGEDPIAVARGIGGVAAVFDPVGGPTTVAALSVLNPGGRLIAYGFMAERGPPLLGAVRQMLTLARRGSGRSSFYRLSRSVTARPEVFRQDLRALLELLEAKRIRPRLGGLMSLAEAAEAHRRLEAGEITGRLLLKPDVGP